MELRAQQHLTDRLRALLGSDGLLLPGGDLERYVTEPRGRFHGLPLAVARPSSTRQVAAVVSLCREAQVPMIPQGGNTGLVGGTAVCNPGHELIISLEGMRAVRAIDAEGASIVVEAGCPLARVQEAAASAGLLYPQSLASEGSATIGGNIATNAGGNMTIRYGNTRRQVLGLEVVLADGRIHDGLTALRKDNSGYDINQLFVGSEGTLGIITAATLALAPAPRQSLTALVGLASLPDSLALLTLLRRELGETLSAFELIPRLAMDYVLEHLADARDPMSVSHPWHVLLQADTAMAGQWLHEVCLGALEAAMDQSIATDVVVAGNAAQANALWRLREAISPAQKVGGASIKHDISVPVAAIPAFVDEAVKSLSARVPGIRPCVFGHLGDGNLHFNLSQPDNMAADAFLATERDCNRIVFDLVTRYRGSIAAEHGIGQLRRLELAARADPVRLSLMSRLKQSLDPEGLFNPGKVIGPD